MLIFKYISILLISFSVFNFSQAQIEKKISVPVSPGLEWTSSFYTDDSSYYLTLFPDGFKQFLRVDAKSCEQISQVSVVFKDPAVQNLSRVKFQKLLQIKSKLGRPGHYSAQQKSNFCWYAVEARGISLASKKSIQYVLKIDSALTNRTVYFKGIKNSLLPTLRLTEMDTAAEQIDTWIDLGQFGSTPVSGGGVFYKIWEPLSEQVDLFINQRSALKMNSQFGLNDERRFHFLYVADSADGDKYHFQFVKNGQYENLEIANFKMMSPIKVDPMARDLVYDARGGRYNGYVNPRAVVRTDNHASEFIWKNDAAFQSMRDVDFNNWIIYQLWPLAFNPQEVAGVKKHGTLKDIATKIPYLNQLGINAVEFLPVNVSRFNASWGYALDSLLIVDSSLGTKADLKKIIDQLHGQQIRVVFDVVINHINNSLIRDPLTGTNNTSKFYRGDTPWGPRPKFESVWVRKWILDSLVHLRREFHLDGFRFDMTDSIFNGSAAGTMFLQELNTILKQDDLSFYITAEQLPDNIWVTYPQEANGLGFDAQWNDRFKNFFELEFDHYRKDKPNVDLKFLAQALLGYSDHNSNSYGDFYHFGEPQRTVNYLGSHDFVGNKNPLLRIVTGYNATEKIGQNMISQVNPLEDLNGPEMSFAQIHTPFSHAVTRLAYGVLFTKPGASLFYQGEELAQDLNLENEWSYMAATDGNRFPSEDVDTDKYVRSHQMPWLYWDFAQGNTQGLGFVTDQQAQLFTGHFNFFKRMIQFKKAHPEINLSDARQVKYDNQLKILVYEIKTNKDWFFIILNFGEERGGAPIFFPGNSNVWWNELINSSTPEFSGENGVFRNVISNQGGHTNLIRLSGPAFYLFEASDLPVTSEKLYFRSSLNAWSANLNTLLKTNPQNTDELITFVTVPADQVIEFKIGNKNWDIDIGRKSSFESIIFDESILTYEPYSLNVTTNLKAGRYQFSFDLRTFKYRFDKI